MAQAEDGADLAAVLGGPHDRRTMGETVADRLRELIIEGQLAPGMILRQARVAEQLGVSIMPVREAFRLLEAERLVVVNPRHGATVAELSVEDIEETYVMRAALEGLAARHATTRLTADDTADIQELFERMEHAKRRGDLREFIAADHDFHMRLYVASGRESLIRSITELTTRSRRYSPYGYAAWQPLDIALRAHEPILEAIAAGDARLVEERTRQHMADAGTRLLEAVQREVDARAQVPTPTQARKRAG